MKTLFYGLLLLFLVCNCRAVEPIWELCNKDSNISRNSQISKNIDLLLARLVSETPSKGFTEAFYGNNGDRVYGLAQCRGDISQSDCSGCIEASAKTIRQRCPDQSDARIMYDFCFLRYSQENFLGRLDTGVGLIYYNVANVTETDAETFNKELGALFDRIRSEAVVPANKGLGKGKTKLTPFVTLYALVQCTRDLTELDCAQSFAIAIRSFQGACNNKKGCRVLYSSCYVRYEFYPFYNPLEQTTTKRVGSVSSVQLYP